MSCHAARAPQYAAQFVICCAMRPKQWAKRRMDGWMVCSLEMSNGRGAVDGEGKSDVRVRSNDEVRRTFGGKMEL